MGSESVKRSLKKDNSYSEIDTTIGLEISYFSEYIDSIFPESVNNRIKEIEEKDMKTIKEEVKKKLNTCLLSESKANEVIRNKIQNDETLASLNGKYIFFRFCHRKKGTTMNIVYQLKYGYIDIELEHKYKKTKDNIIWTESLKVQETKDIIYNYLGLGSSCDLEKKLKIAEKSQE